MAFVGSAVDYSRANAAKTSIQSALDAALLAGAKDGSTNWMNIALTTFNANAPTRDASVSTPTFLLDGNRAYLGSVSATVQSRFMNLFGIKSIDVGAAGTVRVGSASGAYYCVMALNPNAQAALQLTGESARNDWP